MRKNVWNQPGIKETPLPVKASPFDTSLKRGLLSAGKILLVLIFAIHAFNINYEPVTGGLDPSWQYIINYGFEQRIEFSFTSGPMGFINYPLNVGANLEISLVVRLLFWLVVSGGFGYMILKEIFPLRNLVLFIGLFALGSQVSFDYLVCFIILFLLSCAIFSPRPWIWAYGIVMGLSAFLALVKLSAAMLAIAACVMFSVLMFWVDRRKAWLFAKLTILGIPVLFAIFYLAYDPSLSRMFSYIRRALDISAGYNVVMSVAGPSLALWLALSVAIAYLLQSLILFVVHRKAGFLGIIYLPAVFFAFKHGFVRQDGHEGTFFAVLPVLFGLLWLFTPLTKRTWMLVGLLLPVLVVRLGISNYSVDPESMFGIHKLVKMSEVLDYDRTKTDLDAITAKFLQQYRLPLEWTRAMGQQVVSIFPWETAYAPANHLNYHPFPIIQAYSAYTAYLDSENAHFLARSSTAPNFVLMEWVAIDYRHALLDVPETWLELYRWYDGVMHRQTPASLSLLQRRESPRFGEIKLLKRQSYTMGDFLEIPVSEHPILMKVYMDLTTVGKLIKLLFRVPEVTMEIVGTHGSRVYRIVPETLRNPLFINTLPISLHDVSRLINDSQWRNRVYGVVLSGRGRSLYTQQIQVEFYEIPDISLTPVPVPEMDFLSDWGEATAFEVEKMSSYTPQASSSASFLLIKGWAIDQQTHQRAGAVYLEIDGQLYPSYYGLPRADLVERFQRPEYGNAGFQAAIPLSDLGKGRHTISIKILSTNRNGYYSSPGEVTFEIP